MKNASEGWIASLYILAFIRACIGVAAGVYALIVSEIEVGTLSVGTWAFLDSTILAVLGVGALKRHLWAGYGLIIYSVLDFLTKVISGALPGAFGGLFWLALFTMGTIHLFRFQRFASPIRLDPTFILLWVAVLLLISFLAGFFQTFNPALIAKLLGPPRSPSRIWITRISAHGLTLAGQTLAALRRKDWPLEHILCVALAVSVAGGLLDLAFGRSLLEQVGASWLLFILTFAAWGIASKLKPRAESTAQSQ